MKARLSIYSHVAAALMVTFSAPGSADSIASNRESDAFISGPYEANWASLKAYQTPEWFRDGKLGIFIHWGPYVVPKFLGPFYGYHMYREQTIDIKGNPNPDRINRVYQHHIEHYGGTEQFGYKDFISLFNGKDFDAKQWIDLFEKAGAKYVVPVAEHCDGFAMYDSTITRWNAVNMGPKRDVVGEIFTEARKRGMKVGMSSHYAYGWYWWGYKEGTDTMDPAFEDFYGKPHDITEPHSDEHVNQWYLRSMDMIKQYQPDLLWFDLGFSNPEYEEKRKALIAQYYNQAAARDQGVVLNYKNISYKPVPDGAAVLDVESGKLDRIRDMPWQTDMSLGGWRWSYNDDWQTMPANQLIGDLVDIVSKNGSLLLNVAPDVNGIISEDQVAVLHQLGAWLDSNGEGIYGTRPFSVFGQGPTNAKLVLHGNHKDTGYTSRDIRYTRKGQTVYAFVLEQPKPGALISLNALGSEQHHLIDSIKRISLLADNSEVSWTQHADKLTINLPASLPGNYALGIKIELNPPPADVL